MPEKKFVALWLRITSYILIGISVVLDYFSNLAKDYVSSGIEAAGRTISLTLIPWIIGIICGNKCSKWAVKIKKSPNVAYIIGFLFSLLGLLIYWIYYKIKFKKLEKNLK